MAKLKQLPAGKSKAVKAAAKRKAASKASSKKSTTNKKSSSSKVASSAPVAAPTAAVSAKAPVSSPNGSLISQETWQSDQARLQAASEDQDTVDSLNETESEADRTYTSRTTEAAKAAAQRKLELSQQKSEFEKSKSTDYKSLDTGMAYRGLSRSSAAERGTKTVATEHANIANQYKTAETDVDSEVSDINTKAFNEREATKGYVTKRRGSLANRAASRGVYSVGSDSEDSGIEAPGITSPSAPSATKTKTFKGKYQGPDKYKGNMKKVAAAKAAAAKRRIAAKKGKK